MVGLGNMTMYRFIFRLRYCLSVSKRVTISLIYLVIIYIKDNAANQ